LALIASSLSNLLQTSQAQVHQHISDMLGRIDRNGMLCSWLHTLKGKASTLIASSLSQVLQTSKPAAQPWTMFRRINSTLCSQPHKLIRIDVEYLQLAKPSPDQQADSTSKYECKSKSSVCFSATQHCSALTLIASHTHC